MSEPNYESIWVDGIGTILVDEEVAELYPKGHDLWSEIGMFIQMAIRDQENTLNAQRSTPLGRQLLRMRGVPNHHVRISFSATDGFKILHHQALWFEFVHTSIGGDELRRIIFVRKRPPFEFKRGRRRK